MTHIIYQNQLDQITIALMCSDEGTKPMVVLFFDALPPNEPLRIAFAPSMLDFIATTFRDCERILYHQEVEPDANTNGAFITDEGTATASGEN